MGFLTTYRQMALPFNRELADWTQKSWQSPRQKCKN